MNSKRKATKKLGTSRLTDELKKEDYHTRVMRIFQEKEKLKSKLDKREQVRLERLKIAAESGKLRITCKGIYETLPCIDCNQHHKVASIKLENSHKKACYRPGILSATPSTSYCSEVQFSEDRQEEDKMSEFSFKPSSQNKKIKNDTSTVEVCDLEIEQLRKHYYQEMLSQEESALRARVLYENKLLEKAKKKHKSFQVQQVQQELADKKRIDETKLKLESVIKRRIRLEAISYALQKEEKRLAELERRREIEEQNQQEIKGLQEKMHSSIVEQMSSQTVYRKTPYPGTMPSKYSGLSQSGSKAKSVQIREDLSIINGSDYSIKNESSSLLSFTDSSSLATTNSTLPSNATSGSTGSSKGVIRMDSFHHIFEEQRSNESTTSGGSSQHTSSKSEPIMPYMNHREEKQDDNVLQVADSRASKISSNVTVLQTIPEVTEQQITVGLEQSSECCSKDLQDEKCGTPTLSEQLHSALQSASLTINQKKEDIIEAEKECSEMTIATEEQGTEPTSVEKDSKSSIGMTDEKEVQNTVEEIQFDCTEDECTECSPDAVRNVQEQEVVLQNADLGSEMVNQLDTIEDKLQVSSNEDFKTITECVSTNQQKNNEPLDELQDEAQYSNVQDEIRGDQETGIEDQSAQLHDNSCNIDAMTQNNDELQEIQEDIARESKDDDAVAINSISGTENGYEKEDDQTCQCTCSEAEINGEARMMEVENQQDGSTESQKINEIRGKEDDDINEEKEGANDKQDASTAKDKIQNDNSQVEVDKENEEGIIAKQSCCLCGSNGIAECAKEDMAGSNDELGGAVTISSSECPDEPNSEKAPQETECEDPLQEAALQSTAEAIVCTALLKASECIEEWNEEITTLSKNLARNAIDAVRMALEREMTD